MIPSKCLDCTALVFAPECTIKCPNCGSKNTRPAAIVHFLEECDSADRDERIKSGNHLLGSASKPIPKRVSCFSKPYTKPLPTYLTTDIQSVTCPKCLQELEVTLDDLGRPTI